MELDPTNVIILCESRGKRDCHYLWGHLGLGWDAFNREVVAMADMMLKQIRGAKS